MAQNHRRCRERSETRVLTRFDMSSFHEGTDGHMYVRGCDYTDVIMQLSSWDVLSISLLRSTGFEVHIHSRPGTSALK